VLDELLQRRIAPLRWPMMKSARNEGDVMMAAEMITSRDERKKVEMRFAIHRYESLCLNRIDLVARSPPETVRRSVQTDGSVF
jgi:hypothetical protein